MSIIHSLEFKDQVQVTNWFRTIRTRFRTSLCFRELIILILKYIEVYHNDIIITRFGTN